MDGSTSNILSTCSTPVQIEQSSAGRNIFCVKGGSSAKHLTKISISTLTFKFYLEKEREGGKKLSILNFINLAVILFQKKKKKRKEREKKKLSLFY